MFNKKRTKTSRENLFKSKISSVWNRLLCIRFTGFKKKIDLISEAKMQPWDYMAQAFDKELGGKISDWKGNDLNINSDGRVVASYEANHHKKVITLLVGKLKIFLIIIIQVNILFLDHRFPEN